MKKVETNKKGSGNNSTTNTRNQLTISQKASDGMTKFLGSWFFILLFGVVLVIWMTINVIAFELRWDPYPFILLNLCLSCLAAIQAPIIMMSQNRQAERDRTTNKYDYAVNRKAEREIQKVQKDLDRIKRLLSEIKNNK